MATQRLAAMASRCRNCSATAILANLAHPPVRPAALTSVSSSVASHRSFHRTAITCNTSESDVKPPVATEFSTEPMESEPVEESEAPEAEAADGASATFVPWYLQVEKPKITRSPLREQKPLPKIPDDAPEQLSALLKQLSEEQGVDDLVLLDLRHLDRESAVGSNTIMIIGTARSVRHLHGTADRISRWMRSEYRWRPIADGLLGRNELKLINKRKRRRGKVVSTQTGELDEAEGATWICVHERTQGIVVQLLTGGKREELDLEGLWGDVLMKDKERKERYARKLEEDLERAEREEKQTEARASGSGSLPPVTVGPFIQTRAFHYSRRLHNETPSTTQSSSVPMLAHVESQIASLITELTTASHPSAHLGSGPGDTSSTTFLQRYHALLTPLPPALRLRHEIHLLALAAAYKPWSYPLPSLLSHLSTLPLRLEHYITLLHTISLRTPDPHRSPLSPTNSLHDRILSHFIPHLSSTFDQKTAIKFRNSPELAYILWLSLAPPYLLNIRTNILTSVYTPNPQRWIPSHTAPTILTTREAWNQNRPQLAAMTEKMRAYEPMGFPLNPQGYHVKQHQLDILIADAWRGDWKHLWQYWERLEDCQTLRDEEYYNVMLGAVLLMDNQIACLRAARLLPDSMKREGRPVKPVGLTAALLLRVIEGAKKSGENNSEFDMLVDFCMKTRLEGGSQSSRQGGETGEEREI